MAWLREGLLYEDPRAPGILLPRAFPSEGVASWDQPWPGTPSVPGDQSPGKPCSPQSSGCPSCRGARIQAQRERQSCTGNQFSDQPGSTGGRQGTHATSTPACLGTRVWAGGMLRPTPKPRSPPQGEPPLTLLHNQPPAPCPSPSSKSLHPTPAPASCHRGRARAWEG